MVLFCIARKYPLLHKRHVGALLVHKKQFYIEHGKQIDPER